MELFPFQVEGSRFLQPRSRAILGDEPGLGKTVEALDAASRVADRVFVVCPAMVRDVWADHARLVGFRWPVRVVDSASFPGPWMGPGIWIMSYTLATSLYPIVLRYLMAEEADVFIADEAHALKNFKTLQTRRILSGWTEKKDTLRQYHPPLIRYARRAWFLTGTPVLNRPVEFYPLLWASSKAFRSYSDFVIRYCSGTVNQAASRRLGRTVLNADGASNIRELLERISPFYLRRRRRDVMQDLPEAPFRRRVIVPSSSIIRSLTKREHDLLASLGGDYRLALSPRAGFTEFSRIRHELGIAKIPFAVSYILELLDDGVDSLVVFCSHHDVIDGIREGLRSKIADDPIVLDGRESDREAGVRAFQQPDGPRVVLVGIRAGGQGITLTRAARALFVEYDFAPGILRQAEDRILRIGQRRGVVVEYLTVEGTLDTHALEILETKEGGVSGILGSDGDFSESAYHSPSLKH